MMAGTRSWSKQVIWKEGDAVWVSPTVFDDVQQPENKRYSSKYPEGTLLEGTIKRVYQDSTVSVKFECDKTICIIAKSDLVTQAELQRKQNVDKSNKDTGIASQNDHLEQRVVDKSNHDKEIPVASQNDIESDVPQQDTMIVDKKRKYYTGTGESSNATTPKRMKSDSDSKTKDKPKPKLCDGQEVYLTFEGDSIFRAKYQSTGHGETTVHGKTIQEGHGRFFITHVMKKANNYPGFDEDTTCVGSAILWRKEDCMDFNRPEIEKPGTEELVPDLADTTPKKKRTPGRWKRNIRKVNFNAGQRYESPKKRGKQKGNISVLAAKKCKSACKDNCRMGCADLFKEEDRKQIFDDYWSLPDITEKRQFIMGRVRQVNKQRSRKRDKDDVVQRSRGHAYKYSFVDPNDELNDIDVCQTMFLNTLSISKTMVKTAFGKRTPTGGIERDQRGRHGNQKRIETEREQRVIDHIRSFRVVESHYVRKTEKAQFLPQDLSIREMHRLYIEYCEEKCFNPENYDFYKRVFKRRFRLKFQKPKKDQCNECTTYNNTEEKTEEIESLFRKHMQGKMFTRVLKERQKEEANANSDEIVTAAFDLEQVLLSPYGPTGAFYYSRRLQNHNLTVTEINTMNTYSYLWNENECEKASCEVATGVFKFLQSKSQEGIKYFNLFSDRCGGQNQNRMMFIMLSDALSSLKLKQIEYTFLVPGHSQNENDTAHSTIEGHYRNRYVYTSDQWETTIEQAFIKNQCKVDVLLHDDIIDFKNPQAFPEYSKVLADKCFPNQSDNALDSPNNESSVQKKVMWSRIVQLKVLEDNPNLLYFKYNYDESYRTCEFRVELPATRCKGRKYDLQMMKQKYQAPRGISAQKKNDLLALCQKGYVPKQHHNFYKSLQVRGLAVDNALPDLHGDIEELGS